MSRLTRWPPVGLPTVGALAAAFLLMSMAACGANDPAIGPPPSPTATGTDIAAEDITPILATTQLRVGAQRVAFILDSSSGLVTTPAVRIATSHGGADGPTAEAAFRKWPFGTRGSYATDLGFDQPGVWAMSITGDGIDGTVVLTVDVAQDSIVADVGEIAPFSTTKTLEDAGGDLATITSHSRPDPDLYRKSIVDAIISGKPTVVVFASPAFCTSPTCGPEVDTLVDLKDAHEPDANFIHVEVYDNPAEIQGDLTQARLSPHLTEWGIDQVPGYKNESWTFVIGRDGRITQRFEGYATFEEIEAALLEALG